MKYLCATIVILGAVSLLLAQTLPSDTTTKPATQPKDLRPKIPAVLPGNGLAQHDFFYAGESKQRRMFIVRSGQVVWSYDDPAGKGEISDATLLSNGDILFSHQFAVELISPDKKILWSYDVPKGSEVHTAIPIGATHILFVQNGDPAFVRIVDISTGQTVKQFNIPVKNPKSVHGQFRHARLTAAGTLLLTHMDMGKIIEYDADGNALRTIDAPGVWGANPLNNGDILYASKTGLTEIDPHGTVVWTLSKTDYPDFQMPNLQLATRLPNGNTIFNSWANEWSGKVDSADVAAQALEVTPDKLVVWALHQWDNPNLGPATTIQILNEPDAPENVHFGDIR